MIKISTKVSLCIGIFAGFVVTLQAIQGTFKTFWSDKKFRISKSSQNFLSTIVPLHQELFAVASRQDMKMSYQDQQRLLMLLQLSSSWVKADTVCGRDIDRFWQFIQWRSVASVIPKNHEMRKSSDQLIRSIAQIIAREIKQVYIGTAQKDLRYIQDFLKEIDKQGWQESFMPKAIHVFGVVEDIMHYFDGVSITEYDFMVLSQCALFMQLLVI